MMNKSDWQKLFSDLEERLYPIDQSVENIYRRTGYILAVNTLLLPVVQRLEDLSKDPVYHNRAQAILRDLARYVRKQSEIETNEKV